jgi:hypothetical protein
MSLDDDAHPTHRTPQSSKAAKQQSSKAAKQQSSKAAKQQSSTTHCPSPVL